MCRLACPFDSLCIKLSRAPDYARDHIAAPRNCLRQRVLPCLDRLLRNVLAQRNRVERFVLGQAPHNRQLRPQHVAFGYVGYDFLGRRLDFFEPLR